MTSTKVDLTGSVVHKTATATVTKVDSDGLGGFEALVAVFGNEDSQGDVVVKGAFTDSIKARGDKPFPVLWAHQFHDDTAIIATATAEETDAGLVFRADFLDTPRAQNIRALMAAGVVDEFSWSGRVTSGAWIEEQDGDDWSGYYEIRKVDLWEAGPCFKGANPETELLGVKALADRLATKEGRVLAQKHVDALKTAIESLTDLLAAVEKVPDEEKSAAPHEDPPPPAPEPAPEPLAPAGGFVIPASHKARLALA